MELQRAINADAGLTLSDDEKLLNSIAKEGAEFEINKDAKRNPESAMEKLQVKRMKAACAETRAVSSSIYNQKPGSKLSRGQKSQTRGKNQTRTGPLDQLRKVS